MSVRRTPVAGRAGAAVAWAARRLALASGIGLRSSDSKGLGSDRRWCNRSPMPHKHTITGTQNYLTWLPFAGKFRTPDIGPFRVERFLARDGQADAASRAAYLKLLDRTWRQARAAGSGFSQRGVTPNDLQPILDQPRIVGDWWLDSVRHFGRWFHRALW